MYVSLHRTLCLHVVYIQYLSVVFLERRTQTFFSYSSWHTNRLHLKKNISDSFSVTCWDLEISDHPPNQAQWLICGTPKAKKVDQTQQQCLFPSMTSLWHLEVCVLLRINSAGTFPLTETMFSLLPAVLILHFLKYWTYLLVVVQFWDTSTLLKYIHFMLLYTFTPERNTVLLIYLHLFNCYGYSNFMWKTYAQLNVR